LEFDGTDSHDESALCQGTTSVVPVGSFELSSSGGLQPGEGSAVRWTRWHPSGTNRRSFDCAAARSAESAHRKTKGAASPLRITTLRNASRT